MRREDVVLLDLVIAHVAVFVHATTLQDVEHGGTDSERFVFQEALLNDNAKVQVVVIVVEIQLMAARAKHEVEVDFPIMLETEGVEGVEGKDRLVEIGPACTFWNMDVFKVEPKVLLLHTCGGVERPNTRSWGCRNIGSDGVDRLVEVDMFDERGIAIGEVGPLRDGVLAMSVGSREREPL